jgi:hypothetical protein
VTGCSAFLFVPSKFDDGNWYLLAAIVVGAVLFFEIKYPPPFAY